MTRPPRSFRDKEFLLHLRERLRMFLGFSVEHLLPQPLGGIPRSRLVCADWDPLVAPASRATMYD
jgi:hypothetical protein